jgi:hypothetical protein
MTLTRKQIAVLAVTGFVVAVTLAGFQAPVTAAPPPPHNFWGIAYDSMVVPLQYGTPLSAWVDGVEYSNDTFVYDPRGAYDLDVYGNYYTNGSNPNTIEIKEGADDSDSVLFSIGDMTTLGRVFTASQNWNVGDVTPLDLTEATSQAALLKISCITLRPTSGGSQSVWVSNPTGAPVDLSDYYLKKDGVGATDYLDWQMPLSGTVAPNGDAFVGLTSDTVLNATGDDLELVWENVGGTGFGGAVVVIDRVEWNQTVGGTHYWEASNTLLTDASLSPMDRTLRRTPTNVTDTNSGTDFTTSYSDCGNAGPEDFPPMAPLMLPATLVGAGLSDVLVTWQLSPDDGGNENDVSGYEVWVGEPYDGTATTYALLASVPSGTSSYVDTGAGVGDTAPRYYQVRAIEAVSGRWTAAAEQAGKYARFIPAGPALISVPLEQADWAIDTVLQTIPWTRARTFVNPAGQGKNWRSNDQQKPWADLLTVDRRMALWVQTTTDAWWTLAGLVPATTAVALETGWNFLGYPGLASRTVGDVLAGASVQTVEGFASDPPFNLRRLSLGDMMGPGNGYWVHVSTDAVVVFAN